jgi:death-on-curing family protein
MPRPSIPLPQLAQEAGLSLEEARQRLKRVGVRITHKSQVIPRSKLARARRALDITSATAAAARDDEGDTQERSRPNSKTSRRQQSTAEEPASPPDASEWRVVGKVEPLIYLDADDVLTIHFALVEDFARSGDPIDPPGLRDRGLLESATARPMTSLGGELKYPTVPMAGAALFHAVVHDHPFHNGNKRTGLVALIVFLDRNGYLLQEEEDALFDFVLTLSAHRLVDESVQRRPDAEMMAVAEWFKNRIRREDKSEYVLKFRQFRKLLTGFGCEFSFPGGRGNRINIVCGDRQTQIYYEDEGFEVKKNTIQKVRQDLCLDEEHGIDSRVFYGKDVQLPEFIVEYRGILERLASV